VLDPDNGNPFPPRLLDQSADVRNDRVALVSPFEDGLLCPPTVNTPTDSEPERTLERAACIHGAAAAATARSDAASETASTRAMGRSSAAS
jgi:hypothetical protein